ncbi:MAG: DUF45 domain-containing protein [Candidatus Diapherotrites archaeon]|nr:DUF45 domain-containing protein [Candidatus Diapherotrites archaeon]
MVSSADYDSYLARKVAALVRENFPEKAVTNLFVIRWGRKSKSVLGKIKPLKDKEYGSIIEINSRLKSVDVPEYVLDYVLMHELVHYFQGFGSNHAQKSKYPHKGKVVEKELERLGWGEVMGRAERWIKENWRDTAIE